MNHFKSNMESKIISNFITSMNEITFSLRFLYFVLLSFLFLHWFSSSSSSNHWSFCILTNQSTVILCSSLTYNSSHTYNPRLLNYWNEEHNAVHNNITSYMILWRHSMRWTSHLKSDECRSLKTDRDILGH